MSIRQLGRAFGVQEAREISTRNKPASLPITKDLGASHHTTLHNFKAWLMTKSRMTDMSIRENDLNLGVWAGIQKQLYLPLEQSARQSWCLRHLEPGKKCGFDDTGLDSGCLELGAP